MKKKNISASLIIKILLCLVILLSMAEYDQSNTLAQNQSSLNKSNIQRFHPLTSDSALKKTNGASLKAVSLKVLQKELKICREKGTYPKELLHLSGLTKIMGYVIDKHNKDVILIGESNLNSPPLYLEDFVIALRYAWLKYAEQKGNTKYYTPPGCSIDPDPKVFQKLQIFGQQIFNTFSPDKIKKGINEWEKICQSPQKVQVFGIPFNTHFAKVMVTADYDMKSLVDGTVSLNIKGFTSLTEIVLEKIKADLLSKKTNSDPFSSMNRFWFHPGENLFEEDQEVVIVKNSPVILLTEEESLNKNGAFSGKGRPNNLARQFAEKFTAKYNEIAQERPIYTELENLFCFVALAQIIKFKSLPSKVGLDLEYFLEHYPIPKTQVSSQLPGRSSVNEFKHCQDLKCNQQLYLWLPTCGGVSMNIQVAQEQFKKDPSKGLTSLRTIVLSSRYSNKSLSWDIGENFKLYCQILHHINQEKNKNVYSSSIVDKNINKEQANILTIQKQGNKSNVLMKTKNGPELWVFKANELIECIKNETAIKSLEKNIRKLIQNRSDNKVCFLHASSFKPNSDQEIIIQAGNQKIEVKQSELNNLLSGHPNTPTLDTLFNELKKQNKTNVIIYRDPFHKGQAGNNDTINGYYHKDLNHVNPRVLLLALRERYETTHRFYLDDEMDLGYTNFNNLPIVKNNKDIAAYISYKERPEKDGYSLKNNIGPILEKAEIQVMKEIRQVNNPFILIISDHEGGSFGNYVDKHIKAESLQGKYVILFSCYHAIDEAFIYSMIQEGGAKAILYYPENINPQALEKVFLQLKNILKKPEKGANKVDDLLAESIKEALSKKGPPDEIIKIYRLIILGEMNQGYTNLKNLPEVKSTKDIAAYINDKKTSFIKDYEVIKGIETILKNNGIQVIKNNAKPVEASNIVIITGHKEQAFYDYIEKLIKEGSLTGKYVVLFSCYQPGDEAFNSRRIIQEGGAKATLFYPGKINPQAVQEVLKQLSDDLKKGEILEENLHDLLNKSVDQVLEQIDNPEFKLEIEKMREGIIQISSLALKTSLG